MKALLLLLLALCCSNTAARTCTPTEGSGNVLLFSIRAHSGRNSLVEYNNVAPKDIYPKIPAIPNHFRSAVLNDIPSAVKLYCTKIIVIEMQKAGKAVAFAAFDAQDSGHMNSSSWFTPSRLVQTYPYWTGQSVLTDFGLTRSARATSLRNFFIHSNQEGCDVVSGLMGIGESNNDSCSWVTNGGSPPVLFYARKEGPLSRVVAYADQFIIYMTNETEIRSTDRSNWPVHKPRIVHHSTPWSSWGSCTKTCGPHGTRSRTRVCHTWNNLPANGSRCYGGDNEIQGCNTGVQCPVTYNWTKWSSWSSCTKTCGPHGTKSRTRTCQASNNSSANASRCHGADNEIQGCNTAVQCPVTYHWTKWLSWSPCTKTCGPNGTRSRTRTCQASNNSSANASHCHGAENEIQGCNTAVKCPEAAKPKAFYIGSGKVLLFSIQAHSGRNSLYEYNNAESNEPLPTGSGIPALFRSKLLNNLSSALKVFKAKSIVVEMQKAGKAVAWAEFDVSDSAGLNSHNWFTPRRLVRTFPFWTGRTGFTDFGIQGHREVSDYWPYYRNFYIHNSHGHCVTDSGLMGIGESRRDPCMWVTNGGSPPVLFYAKEAGPYSPFNEDPVVAYADQFIVYMKLGSA